MFGFVLGMICFVGLCLGSFVNALVWRLRQQELLVEQDTHSRKLKTTKGKSAEKPRELTTEDLSILRGRSMCPHCHHQLAVIDLVPVASWVLLRGRCRYCRHKIEDNPLVELFTGVLFGVSYVFWPGGVHGLEQAVLFAFWLTFVVGFVTLAVYDLRWYILPDRVVFPLIGLAAAQLLVRVLFFHAGWSAALGAVWGVLIASGIFFVLFQISGGAWIGGGDVKLGIVLGLLLGGPFRGFLLLFLASMLGTLVSLPLLAAGKAKRGTLIPFGPFLLAATFMLVLVGDRATDWLNGWLIR